MDAPTLARAFEPFFTTKPVGKGTGLGLAMARGFAEQSGGALSITSAPGCGTTVLLWLPQAEDSVKPVPADRMRVPRRDSAAKTRTPRILLVDDDAAVRELLAEELIGRNFHVEQAGDGISALEHFGDGGVDLLVSDLSMPGMDGLALITAVQQRRPGLPAILLTGYARDGVSLAGGGLVCPAYTLLCKPVRAMQLCDCIAGLLETACILDAPLSMDRRRSEPSDRRRNGRADRRCTPPPTVG